MSALMNLPVAQFPSPVGTPVVGVALDNYARKLVPETVVGMDGPLQYSNYAMFLDMTVKKGCDQSYDDLINPCALPYKDVVVARGGYVYGENPQSKNKYHCGYLKPSVPYECA
jgi:hypothetical protein